VQRTPDCGQGTVAVSEEHSNGSVTDGEMIKTTVRLTLAQQKRRSMDFAI
jgi:hypothetical protein